MPNSPGAYAFYEKNLAGNSVAEPSTISLFSIDQPTPQVIQTRSYTFTNYLLGEKTVKRREQHVILLFEKNYPTKTDSFDEWLTYLFCLLFSAAIFRAALAPEDAHSICLSEPLAPITKFPTREWSVAAIKWSVNWKLQNN